MDYRETQRINKIIEQYRNIPLLDLSNPDDCREIWRQIGSSYIPKVKKMEEQKRRSLEHALANRRPLRFAI